MKLADYIATNGTSQAAIARAARVSHSWACRAANGRAVSPEVAARISAATHGEVSIAELLYPDGVPDGARLSPLRSEEARAETCALCQGAGEVGGTPCPACVPAVAGEEAA